MRRMAAHGGVTISLTQGKCRAGGGANFVVATRQRPHLLDTIERDDDRPMDPYECIRVEPGLDRAHGFPQEGSALREMQPHVVVVGSDPGDVLHWHDAELSSQTHDEAARVGRPRIAGVDMFHRRMQTLGRERLAAPTVLRFQSRTHPEECRPHALVVERLDHVVHGVELERLYREPIVGGHEHDFRPSLRIERLCELDPGESGHLDVEKHQIGRELLDGIQRFLPIRCLGNDIHVGFRREHVATRLANEWLIVHQHHSRWGERRATTARAVRRATDCACPCAASATCASAPACSATTGTRGRRP